MDSDQLLQAAAIFRDLGLLKAETPDLLPVYAAIGGAVAAGLSGILPNALATWHYLRRERATVLGSLLAEIRSLCQVIETRQYIENARACRDEAAASEQQRATFTFFVPDHYNQVFKANLPHIGKLDPVDATDIMAFYQLIDAAVLDVRPGGAFDDFNATPEGLSQFVELLQTAVAIANKLCARHPI